MKSPTNDSVKIGNISCSSCLLETQSELLKQPGVAKVDIDYNSSLALVTYNPTQISPSQIAQAVPSQYTAAIIEGN